jgi:hypothetical protein
MPRYRFEADAIAVIWTCPVSDDTRVVLVVGCLILIDVSIVWVCSYSAGETMPSVEWRRRRL